MTWTSVLSWATGEKLRAAKLNQAVTAVGELQANANAVVYDQTVTSGSAVTWTSNAARQLFPAATWPSASGFTGGTTVTTPVGGCYAVQLFQTLSSGSFAASTRYYLECDDGVYTFAHGNAPAGVSETVMSAFGVTSNFSSFAVISPYRFQNTGSSITLASIRLRIVRIPAV